MDKEREIILVPCDFTINSENSLLHAIQLAKVADSKVMLTHFVYKGLFSKELTEEEKTVILSKLNTLANEIEKEYNIKPETLVYQGKIVKSIKDLMIEKNINLVIMGQHYEFGKHKLEVAELINIFKISRMKNNSPIIAISGPPAHARYVEIVVPINYQREFKETLRWVMHLSKYYKCNINFIKPFYSDPEKKKLMANNMYFTKKMLDNNNIVYGIKTAKKQKSYTEETFKFARDIDADLIVIMGDKYRDYIADRKSKNGHEISKVPIMCIKPMPKKFQSFY